MLEVLEKIKKISSLQTGAVITHINGKDKVYPLFGDNCNLNKEATELLNNLSEENLPLKGVVRMYKNNTFYYTYEINKYKSQYKTLPEEILTGLRKGIFLNNESDYKKLYV